MIVAATLGLCASRRGPAANPREAVFDDSSDSSHEAVARDGGAGGGRIRSRMSTARSRRRWFCWRSRTKANCRGCTGSVSRLCSQQREILRFAQDDGEKLEARGGIEPPIKVLQTFALPLGDRAGCSGSSYDEIRS